MGKVKQKRNISANKKTLRVFVLVVAAYLLVCIAVTSLDYMKYLKTRTNTELDTDLVYLVYSNEEIAENPQLESVRLYHFPAANGAKTKCVIYLPGGSYKTCNPYDVCIPAAAEAVEMGYSAFVLTYRVGDFAEEYMPMKDVAAGISYLIDHAADLNIDMDDYMLTGFSAGGHLAGIFGSKELGYEKYGVPKPGAIGLAYPLISTSTGFFENWNMVSDYVNYNLRDHTVKFLLGEKITKEDRELLDVQRYVTPDYPKVFMIQGDADFLVRYQNNSELMAQALSKNGVLSEYYVCGGLTHGFGIGEGTTAYGWNKRAIQFWNEPF